MGVIAVEEPGSTQALQTSKAASSLFRRALLTHWMDCVIASLVSVVASLPVMEASWPEVRFQLSGEILSAPLGMVKTTW